MSEFSFGKKPKECNIQPLYFEQVIFKDALHRVMEKLRASGYRWPSEIKEEENESRIKRISEETDQAMSELFVPSVLG